jgi:hypothetical protein
MAEAGKNEDSKTAVTYVTAQVLENLGTQARVVAEDTINPVGPSDAAAAATADETAKALKKAKDDAVAANIKILENFYSFLIGLAVTRATVELIEIWKVASLKTPPYAEIGATILFVSLMITIVPFYQGMNRFLYDSHVVRPLEYPESRTSPLFLDLNAFFILSGILLAMGQFLRDPHVYFYLWASLLIIDIMWAITVWIWRGGGGPIWARNNMFWLIVAIIYWTFAVWLDYLTFLPTEYRSVIPYVIVLFELARTVFDYLLNWKFYFPAEYKGG